MPTATNTIAMNAPNVETKTAAVPFCKKMTWGLSGALGSHMLEVHISNAVMAVCGVIMKDQGKQPYPDTKKLSRPSSISHHANYGSKTAGSWLWQS